MTKDGKKGFPEDARAILNKLQANKESLHMTRVPKKTREEFITWANEEYCGDYGFAFKALWDDMPKADVRVVMDICKSLEERISNLELASLPQPKSVTSTTKIKMCDGNCKEVKADE